MRKKPGLIALAVVGVVAAAAAVVIFATPAGPFIRNAPAVGAGYAAEMTCAGVFVSGRQRDQVLEDDILPVNPLLKYADVTVDTTQATVTASLFHLARRTA